MADWSSNRMRLAEYLIGLSSELAKAKARGDEDDFRFDVDSAAIEIDVAYSLERSEPQFWVVALELSEKKKDDGSAPYARQRITVRLISKFDHEASGDTIPSTGTQMPRPQPAVLDESEDGEGKAPKMR